MGSTCFYILTDRFCIDIPVFGICFYFVQVMAVVVRTGFSTVKGELVQSILYPKPMSGFKFYQDSVRFILFLFLTATLGMAYCIHLYVKRHVSVHSIFGHKRNIIF
jgi:cation-transporting ATPase 13A3/4/5